MGRVTVRDVAKHAGVSVATVSFVLNDNPVVAAETRARVQKSLRELGYVYDRSAAALRTQRTNAVALIITTLRNPFFADIAMDIQRVLSAASRVVLLGVSDNDVATQSRLLRVMGEHRIDGVVMIPAHGTNADDLNGFGNVPLILLAHRVPGADNDYVGVNNVAGARIATEHLLDHGCRTVAFLGGDRHSSVRTERLSGLRSALRSRGRRRAPAAPVGPPDRATSAGLARELFSRGRNGQPGTPVDGVLCFDDTVAFGVLDAAAELGLTVGEDVRVIGFDDVDEAALNRPALSSVAVPRTAGVAAAELMLRRIVDAREPAETILLETTLNPRESCGCHGVAMEPDLHRDVLAAQPASPTAARSRRRRTHQLAV